MTSTSEGNAHTTGIFCAFYVGWLLAVHLVVPNILINYSAFGTSFHDITMTRGGTARQSGRSRGRFQMVSVEFFIDIIPPVALRPWGGLSL
jgi:hypothetical protein